MTVGQICDWLNAMAPFETAEGFDNVGLLMGDRQTEVHRVLFGMDLTSAMADEAFELGAEMIITHHPFIFHALKRIDYTAPQGQTLCRLAGRGVAVLAAHTNWDRAPGGVSDSLAQALGLLHIDSADDFARVGDLPAPLTPDALCAHVRSALSVEPRCYAPSKQPIRRVAVAGGAYGRGYEAALRSGAQAFVVGEIAHHEILDAFSRGLTILDAGHYATELPGVQALYQRFCSDAQAAGWAVQAHLHTQAPYAGALLAF